MKRYLLTALMLCASLLYGQIGVSQAFINTGQLELAVRNNGIWGSDWSTGRSGLYYPADQREKALLYTAGFQIIGKLDGQLRSAAVQSSTEFQPGPILSDGTAADITDSRWNVQSFERGESIPQYLIDTGCPEEVLGDVMLYTVYNDLGSHDAVFVGDPIGMEVQQTVWAYKRQGALGRAVFMRFRIVNKNKQNLPLDSAYVGIFVDPDLGGANDDALGCDTLRQMGYVYNGAEEDLQYGRSCPALGISVLEAPATTAGQRDRMSAFVGWLNGTGHFLYDPTLRSAEGRVEAYNHLRGLRTDGAPWEEPFTGRETVFPLSGDPVMGTGWLYRHVAPPKDVRMMMGTGPFELKAHEPVDFTFALVVGDDPGIAYNHIQAVALLCKACDEVRFRWAQGMEYTCLTPDVVLEAESHDGVIRLSWPEETVDTVDGVYAFEGYNVWFSDNPEYEKPILTATLDSINGITGIWYKAWDETLALYVNRPVQTGSDAGLANEFVITQHPVTGKPLTPGENYYVGVTRYWINQLAIPPFVENEIMMMPVTVQASASPSVDEITVFPNPYYGHNVGETGQYAPYVTVSGLPDEDCEIAVFSLSGQLVRKISHENGATFERIELVNDSGRALASGMYLIHVKTAQGSRMLKLAVVQRRVF